jgi:hypothetical protein
LDFSKKAVMNKSYDKPYDDFWDAVYIVQQKGYPEITRESKEKGFIEARLEQEDYKEKLTVELLGKGPYKISLSLIREKKINNGWTKEGMISERYSHKIQKEIYEQLYEAIIYPEELIHRIENYNSTQTKDKKKLLKGRDF